MALWIMVKSFKMGSHRILLFIFFYFISRMHCIIYLKKNIQTYPCIRLFEKMMYQRICIHQISIHVSISMLPSMKRVRAEKKCRGREKERDCLCIGEEKKSCCPHLRLCPPHAVHHPHTARPPLLCATLLCSAQVRQTRSS
jgi:hypothetical protein